MPTAGDRAGWAAPWREALGEADGVTYADQTGCFVGSGGGAFEVNYDFFSR